MRALGRIALLLLLFGVLAPVHLATKLILGRSDWPRRFLAAAAWVVGARPIVEGAPAPPHSLLVSNHVSWVDILVLAGVTGCAFVSKDSLGHPFIHWLADQNATVYVKRTQRAGAKDQAAAIARGLDGPQPVALFPEGTTGPGTHLLPFRSTLLEAAKFAAQDVTVRPVALDYGSAATEIGWWNEKGEDNVLRLLARRGTLPVSVRLLDPIDRSGNRKQIAEAARREIARALGFKLDGHSPIGGRE